MNEERKCDFCSSEAVETLDGDQLCKRHADMWLRAEEEEHRRQQEDNGQFGVGA
jgi:hypothetical protein